MLQESSVQRFKKTKIGVLPQDWEVRKVCEVMNLVRQPVSVEKNKLYHQIGIRSHAKGLFYKEPITGEKLGDKRVFWVEPNCFVVNIVFAWERAVTATSNAEIGMIASHRFPMFKPKDDELDLGYITRYFQSTQGQESLSLVSPGGAGRNKTLGQKEFLQLSIPVPPLHEQKKIAAILSSVDEALASTQAVIDQTRKVKQGLLQQLLTRGIGHTKFKESAIGKIPESWEIVPLAQLCEKIVNGYVGATRDIYHEEGTPYILCQNVRANRFVPKIFKWVSKEFHENNSRSALKEGDVITVQTGAGNGDTCVVPPQFDGANCHALIISRAKPNLLNSYYLSEYLNSPEGRARIDVISTGMAYPHLNTTELRKLLIPLPTIQEQDGIVQYLRSFESTIFENEFYLNSLENLKRGLMQDLLTGKVRVGCTP